MSCICSVETENLESQIAQCGRLRMAMPHGLPPRAQKMAQSTKHALVVSYGASLPSHTLVVFKKNCTLMETFFYFET
jgi:hypothetical protein